MQLPQNLALSEKHFHSVLHIQNQLVVLTLEEANIRAKLINIQASLTPHMEILQKELAYTKIVLKKDSSLSNFDGIVHLAVETTIQINSLDVALEN